MANHVPDLSEIDKDLLELAVLTVPWYMVCGDFHRRYGSPGALAKRLIELREAGLLSIEPKLPGKGKLSAQALENNALENDCYDDFDSSWGPSWEISATDLGFAAIEQGLNEQ